MVEKKISIYGDLEVQSPFNSDQLLIEVSNTHMAVLVKLAGKLQIAAFELFQFDILNHDWYDVFYQVRTNSAILDRSYHNTRVFFNFNETVLIPIDKFTTSAADAYMAAVHGDNINYITKFDNVNIEPSIGNVYRIKKPLNEMVNTNLMMVTERHTYTKLLEDLMGGKRTVHNSFLKILFYYNMVVVVVIYYGKLHLIQSYRYQTAEDVLYYLLSIAQQYNLPVTDTQVELSGIIDAKSHQYDYLAKVFAKISFETVNTDGIFRSHNGLYPSHYLSPFINLAV